MRTLYEDAVDAVDAMDFRDRLIQAAAVISDPDLAVGAALVGMLLAVNAAINALGASDHSRKELRRLAVRIIRSGEDGNDR